MTIHFFSFDSYPNGGAACNRHLAYMKSLAKRGHLVRVYVLGQSESSYPGAEFELIYIPLKPGDRIRLFISAFRKLTKLAMAIGKRSGEAEVFVYLGTSGILCIPLIVAARLFRIPLFHERTELPSLMVGRSKTAHFDFSFYSWFVLGSFDGIFVISRQLEHELAKAYGVRPERIHIANMIVDFSRFDPITRTYRESPEIYTYCGDLSSPKDGVEILIDAFKMFRERRDGCILRIIGDTENSYFKSTIEPVIADKGIRDSIEFTGYIGRDRIPALLCDSDVLVLARPNNRQAQFGFPTKLGEYLATRKPVLVTDTGEISLFLTDKVNVIIVAPGDARAFADGMEFIAANYNIAVKIAKIGYTRAEECFSSDIVAEEMDSALTAAIALKRQTMRHKKAKG